MASDGVAAGGDQPRPPYWYRRVPAWNTGNLPFRMPGRYPDLNLIEACWEDLGRVRYGDEHRMDIDALQLYIAVLDSSYYRGKVR